MINESMEKLKLKITKAEQNARKANEAFEKSKKALIDKQTKIHNAKVIEVGELIIKQLGEDVTIEDLNTIITMFKKVKQVKVVDNAEGNIEDCKDDNAESNIIEEIVDDVEGGVGDDKEEGEDD